MSHFIKRFLVIATFVAAIGNSARAGELEGGIEAFLGDPVMETQQVVLHNRSQVWPNIVVALEGSILATYGVVFGGSEPFAKNRRHVAVRRSEDGGKTWGREIVIARTWISGRRHDCRRDDRRYSRLC